MSSMTIFLGFLGYSFVNLIYECIDEEGGDEPFIGTVAAVIGNYIGSAITFGIFYCCANCLISLFR